MPCIRKERKEDPAAGNSYNCPIVMSYPTALGLNIDELAEQHVEFMYPVPALRRPRGAQAPPVSRCSPSDRVADAAAGQADAVRGPQASRASEIDAAVNYAYEVDALVP